MFTLKTPAFLIIAHSACYKYDTMPIWHSVQSPLFFYLTLKIMHLKVSFDNVICCIYLLRLLTYVSKEASSVRRPRSDCSQRTSIDIQNRLRIYPCRIRVKTYLMGTVGQGCSQFIWFLDHLGMCCMAKAVFIWAIYKTMFLPLCVRYGYF